MTSPRDDGRFEVPIERLSDGRGQARRAGAVAVAIVTVLGGAFAIARLGEGTPGASHAVASQVAGGPSSAPAASLRPSGGPRAEALPSIAAVPLPGAPETTLIERVGDGGRDLRVFVWTPDDARTRTIRIIPRAVAADDPSPPVPVLSPDRRHVILLGTSTTGAPRLGDAVLMDDTGATVWRGDGVTATSGVLWSADSRLVVVPGQPRRWDLVRLDRPGHSSARTVTLPGEVYMPYPLPSGWLTFPTVEPRTVPLGFSADGAWIYGGVISPTLGMLVGEFRVASDGSRVEPVADFGVGRADGLAPRPGTPGSGIVDPLTGRIATSRINADTTGGPQTLEVREPDQGFVFAVGGGFTLGSAWGDGGALYALTAESLLHPQAIELRAYAPDGHEDPPLLTTGPLTGAALVGVRDGFAVVALLATRPAVAIELVAVDLAHPERLTALQLASDTQLVGATLDR